MPQSSSVSRPLLSFLGAVGLCSGALVADTSQLANNKGRLWIEAVVAHTAGDRDDSVQALSAWSLRDLVASLDHWIRRPEGDRDPVFLARAAMLHADIAMLNRTESGYGVAGTGPSAEKSVDGAASGQSHRSVHWAFGRLLLRERRARGPALVRDDGFDMRWFRATSAFLLEWRDLAELDQHLTEGFRVYSETDSVLKLIQGAYYEVLAEVVPAAALRYGGSDSGQPSLPGQNVLDLRSNPPPANPTQPLGRDRHRTLRLALQAFEEVTHKLPLGEAALRHSRVLQELGRVDESVQALEQLRSSSLPPPLEYLSALFLGRALLLNDDARSAERAFAAAMVMFPAGQAAKLGLGVARLDQGLPGLAVPLVPPTSPIEDPWLGYFRLMVPTLDDLLADLRRGAGIE